MSYDHSPRFKYTVKTALINELYSQAYNSFEKRKKALIIRNCLLTKSPDESFVYKSQWYESDIRNVRPSKRNMLDARLIPEMEAYLKDYSEMEYVEIPVVENYIIHVLNTGITKEDYMALLPECFHKRIMHSCAGESFPVGGLSQETIQTIRAKNAKALDMIYRRLAMNLII